MNAPGGNNVSTAEHTFSLLLCAAQKIPQADAMLRGGKWDRKNLEGVELYNKTLGILGMGRIGSELAGGRSFSACACWLMTPTFPCPAHASAGGANRRVGRYPDEGGLHYLAYAAERGNHHLSMPPPGEIEHGIRVLNCARGGIIDEVRSPQFKCGHVAGAALDVFETEPPPADLPLSEHPS